MVGKNFLVHKALSEAENSAFQEKTVLHKLNASSGTVAQTSKIHTLASCLFCQLVLSLNAEISAMAPNIRKVDIIALKVLQNRLNLYNEFFNRIYANYVQFWFRRFRSGIFDIKVTPRTGRPVVENVDKTTEIIEIDRHVGDRSIAQKLKINHKTVLSYLRKVE
ncbi:histone-lysine N-methyltransferase SETMAR [Trichonephila clavipes]|nr:histone-lysine N-methyltransferase SETMAR [Trichonephila clavipes]